MKSDSPSGVPSFTPAQALFFAHPAHPGCCALIGTAVPFYGAPSWATPAHDVGRRRLTRDGSCSESLTSCSARMSFLRLKVSKEKDFP